MMTYDLPPDAPIVCTIRPGDDENAILAAYRGLFAEALVGAERTDWGVRWTFRAAGGVEQRVRALAAAEQACCAFLRMAITVPSAPGGPDGSTGTVVWDVIGPANARAFLDEYAQLPRTVAAGADALRDRVAAAGLRFDDRRDPAGSERRA